MVYHFLHQVSTLFLLILSWYEHLQLGFLYLSLHNRMISTWLNCQIIQWFIVSFFVSRMIEESGNKRKTMAEKRQLFIEMRESWVLLESCLYVWQCFFIFYFSDQLTAWIRSFMLQALERREWKLKNRSVGRPQVRVYILIGLTWIAFLSKVINSKTEMLLRISIRSRGGQSI